MARAGADLVRGGRLGSADDEHRTRGVADDVVGDAADEQPTHRAAAVTPDDDEIDGLARGDVDDCLARRAFPDQEAHLDSGFAPSCGETTRGVLTIGPELVDPLAGPGSEVPAQGIDHAEDEQIGAQIAGEVEGLGRGSVGRSGQIGGQQDSGDARDPRDRDHCDGGGGLASHAAIVRRGVAHVE